MNIVAFITFSADIHKMLDHIGVELEAPRITQASRPSLWDDFSAQELEKAVSIGSPEPGLR